MIDRPALRMYKAQLGKTSSRYIDLERRLLSDLVFSFIIQHCVPKGFKWTEPIAVFLGRTMPKTMRYAFKNIVEDELVRIVEADDVSPFDDLYCLTARGRDYAREALGIESEVRVLGSRKPVPVLWLESPDRD